MNVARTRPILHLHRLTPMNTHILTLLLASFAIISGSRGDEPSASKSKSSAVVKPLKALLITGGCCHDYGKQRYLLKNGIESRARVEVEMVHTDNTTTKARFKIYENSNW